MCLGKVTSIRFGRIVLGGKPARKTTVVPKMQGNNY
jgi:hypothetical protein